MSTRLYRITRPGAMHSRYEWPNGSPLQPNEDMFRRDPNTGRDVPVEKHGGVASLVYYGNRNDNPDLRREIRLDDAGAKRLAHMGLVPVLGTSSVIKTEKTDKVEVPDDWESLDRDELAELACRINGTTYERLKIADSKAIIRAYLEDNTEEGETEDGSDE